MTELVLQDGEVISTEAIAREINAEHELCMNALLDTATHAVKVGRLLAEMECLYCRDDFIAWVGFDARSGHCNFTYRTAQRYLDAACGVGGKPILDEKEQRKIVRALCSNGKREQQPQEAPPCPEGAYTLVLADPPWQYDFAETDNRAIENQYATEGVDGIIRLKPPTAEDCILFMWATAPKLTEAMQVMAAWGFEYRTHAMWDKEKIGMGYWFRGQHELLLVGTKGSVHPPQEGDRVGSVFREAREGHSVKPECVYEWIERSFPGFVKLEMFARRERDGWVLWGNEV